MKRKSSGFILIAFTFIFFMSCTNSADNHELKLRERELNLKEKQFRLDSLKFSSKNQSEIEKPLKNALTEEESGKFIFPLPNHDHLTTWEIKFSRNSDDIIRISRTYFTLHEEVDIMTDYGKYKVKFVNSEFKKINCSFEGEDQYDFIYRYDKKRWYIQTDWNGDDEVLEVKGEKSSS